MRKTGFVLAVLLVSLTSLGGLYNSTNELPQAETNWQLAVGFGQMLYGLFGVFATVGFIRRRPWTPTFVAAWAVGSAFVASVASFAFHDPTFSLPGTRSAVIGAGVGTLVVGALVMWAARVATRPKPESVPPAA